ncbi:MAG: hypothetical protein KF778_20570 [Rhodocyclaceae bacterium]|nr:hypothetical protein [Rhodocyclaceae bacterium]
MQNKQIAPPTDERAARTPDRIRTQEYRRRRQQEGREPLTLLIAREAITQLDTLCVARGQQRHELVAELVAAAHSALVSDVAPAKDEGHVATENGKE